MEQDQLRLDTLLAIGDAMLQLLVEEIHDYELSRVFFWGDFICAIRMHAYLPYLDFYDCVERSLIQQMITRLFTDPKLHIPDAGCVEGLPSLVCAEQ